MPTLRTLQALGLGLAGLAVGAAFALSRPFRSEEYETMREDVARTAAFYKAIDALAPDAVVLDLGTGALALLARRAAKAGARRVYAVEASKFAAQEASKVLENKDPVSVILGRSQEIHLPEPVDLVVHEILGEIASREGVVTSLLDAERFVSPAAKLQCWSVPSGAQTMIAPAEMPTPRYFENFRARTGTFLAMPAAGTRMLRFPNLPVSESILAEPQIFEDLKWGKACSMKIHQRRLTRFRVTREGLLSGFVFFIMVHFPVDIAPVSSADEESHWANSFCTVDRPVTVTPGDFLEVESEVDLSSDTPTYVLAAKLRRMGGEVENLMQRYVFH